MRILNLWRVLQTSCALLSDGNNVSMQYGMHEGTSQSAGFVAGAAALLLAAHRAAGVNASGAMMKGPMMQGAAPLTQLDSRCKAGKGLVLAQSSSLHTEHH